MKKEVKEEKEKKQQEAKKSTGDSRVISHSLAKSHQESYRSAELAPRPSVLFVLSFTSKVT